VVFSWVQGVTGRQVFNGIYPDICIFDLTTASNDNSVHRRTGVNQRDIFSHKACPPTWKFQCVASLPAPPSRQHIICPRLLRWFQWTTRPLIQYHMCLSQVLCYYPSIKQSWNTCVFAGRYFRLKAPNCATAQEKISTTPNTIRSDSVTDYVTFTVLRFRASRFRFPVSAVPSAFAFSICTLSEFHHR
jgi:hypothetical protein